MSNDDDKDGKNRWQGNSTEDDAIARIDAAREAERQDREAQRQWAAAEAAAEARGDPKVWHATNSSERTLPAVVALVLLVAALLLFFGTAGATTLNDLEQGVRALHRP